MVNDLINTKSVRKLSAETQVKKTTVHFILKKELNLKPYKLRCHQELSPQDKHRRLLFCNRIKNMCSAGELSLNKIIFSDEFHIYLKGMPKRQKYRKWTSTKPNDFFDRRYTLPR